ncbi:MAG: YGL010W-like membrane protein [Planctomycetota bacterium]|jgi:uncharacterized membrane protein YGL010W
MKTIEQWLDEYNESHQNRINKILHWICVPLIMLSLLGLLWSVSIPVGIDNLSFSLNWAIVLMVFALIYYFLISPKLTLGMLLVSATMFLVLKALSSLHTPLWLISVVIFILAWIGQFIGHKYEGKSPSFFKDLQFLLIGPLWLLSFIYRKLGIHY